MLWFLKLKMFSMYNSKKFYYFYNNELSKLMYLEYIIYYKNLFFSILQKILVIFVYIKWRRYKISHINNYAYNKMYFLLSKQAKFSYFYLKYYLLNILFLFTSIEKTISLYSNTECYAMIYYNVKYKVYLNSSKL